MSQKGLTRADVEDLLHDVDSTDQLNFSNQCLIDIDLRGVNLSGANLSGANLSGANLSGADLSGANLSGANLIDATLSGANLRQADLRRADLRWATLSGTIMSQADLSKANLSRANLSNADLSETDLRGSNLSRAKLSDTNLTGANSSGANLSGTHLSRIALLWFYPKITRRNQFDTSLAQSEASAYQNKDVPGIAGDAEDTSSMPHISTLEATGRIRALWNCLHSRRWTKSLLVFLGLVLAQKEFTLPSLARVLLAFVILCLTSSCIYIMNDLLDLKNDREHPVKRRRPLASGALPIPWAIITMGILFLLAALLTSIIFAIPINSASANTVSREANLLFVLAVLAFLLLTVLYNIWLKHIVLLDVFVTATSAILRVLAGAAVIFVAISPWVYVLTFLLELFFGLGKRRHELSLLQERAAQHRQALREYSIPLLDQLSTILMVGILTIYSLYTFQGIPGNQKFIITVPLVLYAMFRYAYLVHMGMESGIPEEVLFHDPHLLVTAVLYIISIIALSLWKI